MMETQIASALNNRQVSLCGGLRVPVSSEASDAIAS